MKPNSLCCSKQDRFKLYGLREAFSNLFSFYPPPAWPLPFRLTGICESRKGQVFQQYLAEFAPENNLSAYFTLDYYTYTAVVLSIAAKLQRGKTQRFLGPNPKKTLAWAGWPRRLGLILATPWADFAVIPAQL